MRLRADPGSHRTVGRVTHEDRVTVPLPAPCGFQLRLDQQVTPAQKRQTASQPVDRLEARRQPFPAAAVDVLALGTTAIALTSRSSSAKSLTKAPSALDARQAPRRSPSVRGGPQSALGHDTREQPAGHLVAALDQFDLRGGPGHQLHQFADAAICRVEGSLDGVQFVADVPGQRAEFVLDDLDRSGGRSPSRVAIRSRSSLDFSTSAGRSRRAV